MRPPPKHYPRTLDVQFAADPFDPRMHHGGPQREHTPLGLIVEAWAWMRQHEAEIPPAMLPMYRSFYELIQRDAPEHVRDIKGGAGV